MPNTSAPPGLNPSRCLLGIALVSAFPLLSLLSQDAASGAGLIENPSFEVESTKKGIAKDWRLSGPLISAKLDTELSKHGERSQLLQSSGKAILSMWQDLKVEPATRYLFEVWVRSDDRLIVQIGRRRMSHNTFGRWQKLICLVRTAKQPSLRIMFLLGGMKGEANEARIDGVSLRPFPEAPPLPRRQTFGHTLIVSKKEPQAAIIFPAKSGSCRALGERIRKAISGRTGVRLPLISDVDATEPEHPIIRPEYRDRNLILIGRLGINRALWPAYNRFLCAVDGHYPGGDGYVVRTASNVFRNGRNHIIIGGSSDEGVEKAVRRFVTMLEKREVNAQGNFALPWLLDVGLGGECLARFTERDRLWSKEPFHKLLPPEQSGYGTVRRWYQNAMSWYWSGWKSYRKRTLDYLAPVLKDRAYTHHYIVEFFVRAWDMVDDSSLFTDGRRAEVDALIYQNFTEFLTGPDLGWMTIFSPPYESIEVRNRHSIAPWMADITMADFLHDYFDLKGDVGEILKYRRAEKHPFLQYLVAERSGPSMPGSAGIGHRDELIASLFRYALHNERYEFFERGHAKRALGLERLSHLSGTSAKPAGGMDHHLILGILANYFKDGRYLTLLQNLPLVQHVTGPFMGRYVNGVRRYTPGPELAQENPDGLGGVMLSRFMPHESPRLRGLKLRGFRPPLMEPEQAFDMASMRNGFGKDDDFLAINGLAGLNPPGTMLSFVSSGTEWLGSSNAWPAATGNYFTENAVHVLKTDRWMDDDQPHPAAARLDWSLDEGKSGGLGFTMEPFMSMRWQRQIVWPRRGRFVVTDVLTALKDGQYQIAINWRPAGLPSWDGQRWTSVSNTGMVQIIPLRLSSGSDFRVRQNVAAYLANPQTKLHFRQTASRKLKAGESLQAMTVLMAGKRDRESADDGELRKILKDANAVIERAGSGRKPLMLPDTLTPLLSDSEGEKQQDEKDKDESGKWRVAWRYRGMLRPGRIRAVRRLSDEVVDLGKVVEVAQIRATLQGPLWESTRLPSEIWSAVPVGKSHGPPPNTSPAWVRLQAKAEWRPSVHTGNYGQADPVKEGYQVVRPERLKARFIRTANAPNLIYYDRQLQNAGRPLLVKVGDVDGDSVSEILVMPDPWPKYIRRRQEQDDAIALLRSDGTELRRIELPQNIQDAALLDLDDSGHRKIVVTTADAKVGIYGTEIKNDRGLDVYAMHGEFNRREGRPNTRHPAGGYTLPYSFGLWRGGVGQGRKMIMARYGWMSFLDHEGKFEGVLSMGGYVTPALLAQGIDFDQDGTEEQLCLARGVVLQIDGEPEPTVRDPGGHLFYPQVYSVSRTLEPAWDRRIDGPRVILFRPLIQEGVRARYVLIVRENYMGIYDGLEKKWAFAWKPTVSIQSAALSQWKAGDLGVTILTRDDLLWRLRFKDGLKELSDYSVRPLGYTFSAIAAQEDGKEEILLSGNEGLFLMRGSDKLRRIAEGVFQTAQFLPGGQMAIIAITAKGEIIRMEWAD